MTATWDWDVGLGRGIGTWDWDVELGRGIGMWDWDVGLGCGIETWDWDVGLAYLHTLIYVSITAYITVHQCTHVSIPDARCTNNYDQK